MTFKFPSIITFSLMLIPVESDEKSLHAGMDVKNGTKFVINCWIRTKEYV